MVNPIEVNKSFDLYKFEKKKENNNNLFVHLNLFISIFIACSFIFYIKCTENKMGR